MNAEPLIGFGPVWHRRLRPVAHEFRYGGCFLLLPLRRLRGQPCTALKRNGRGWLSFHDADHGDGGPDALAWLEQLLAAEGVHDADGEIWLQTYPRVLGHVFKPVSFWICERADGSLAAIVVEVNNTFGERHDYLVAHPDGRPIRDGEWMETRKVFHVSPFFPVSGSYRFRFDRRSDLHAVAIDYHDQGGRRLRTRLSGRAEAMSRGAALRALCAYPLMTLAVMARIHIQAFHLWRARVPFFRKPLPPVQELTR